jgi:uncharacterized protein (DUF736 family)
MAVKLGSLSSRQRWSLPSCDCFDQAAPIFANLFDDPDGESYTLIWSRSRKKNGE